MWGKFKFFYFFESFNKMWCKFLKKIENSINFEKNEIFGTRKIFKNRSEIMPNSRVNGVWWVIRFGGPPKAFLPQLRQFSWKIKAFSNIFEPILSQIMPNIFALSIWLRCQQKPALSSTNALSWMLARQQRTVHSSKTACFLENIQLSQLRARQVKNRDGYKEQRARLVCTMPSKTKKRFLHPQRYFTK